MLRKLSDSLIRGMPLRVPLFCLLGNSLLGTALAVLEGTWWMVPLQLVMAWVWCVVFARVRGMRVP